MLASTDNDVGSILPRMWCLLTRGSAYLFPPPSFTAHYKTFCKVRKHLSII